MEPCLPGDAAAAQLLERLGLGPADRNAVLAARPDSDDAELARLLRRRVDQLAAGLGGLGQLPDWPQPPARAPLFYVWVFVAAVPYVRQFHAARGIPESATFDVLRELGSQLDNHRAMYGTAGLSAHHWMTVHFRGAMYRIGRLLYERLRLPDGTFALGIHIPPGRLTPESCDDSLGRARAFFRRHFPAEPYELATCTSWVLDDQLTRYLEPDTNIIRFQSRFRRAAPADEPADGATVEAVFRRRWTGLAGVGELPRTTTLERGIADHLSAGGHWYYRTGWLRLP